MTENDYDFEFDDTDFYYYYNFTQSDYYYDYETVKRSIINKEKIVEFKNSIVAIKPLESKLKNLEQKVYFV